MQLTKSKEQRAKCEVTNLRVMYHVMIAYNNFALC